MVVAVLALMSVAGRFLVLSFTSVVGFFVEDDIVKDEGLLGLATRLAVREG